MHTLMIKLKITKIIFYYYDYYYYYIINTDILHVIGHSTATLGIFKIFVATSTNFQILRVPCFFFNQTKRNKTE
jgi:hypothetical protein